MIRSLSIALILAATAGCGQSGSGSMDVIKPAAAQATPVQLQMLDTEYLKSLAASSQSGGIVGSTAATKDLAGATTKLVIGNWNYIIPSYCVGQNYGGAFTLFVVGRDGSVTWTSDLNAVSVLAPACVTNQGVGFQITSTNGLQYLWNAVATYHP